MSFTDIDDRPTKKRRFFADNSPSPPEQAATNSPPAQHEPTNSNAVQEDRGGARSGSQVFDPELLCAVVGQELAPETVARLRELADGDLERAVNFYLDGSWQRQGAIRAEQPVANGSRSSAPSLLKHFAPRPKTEERQTNPVVKHTEPIVETSMPEKRYIGSFGVTCWATRSGKGLIKHGEQVFLERTKMNNTKIGKSGKVRLLNRQDFVVRFTNLRKEEVGRLETDSAAWISSLIDENLCEFEGYCVFAPDVVRTNDTIFLQLKCFFKRVAFEKGIIKPDEDNRRTGLFEAKETVAERSLHLRQVSLVRLLYEINVTPSQSNAETEKHKRETILKAAEDEAEQERDRTSSSETANGGSSPPSEEAEDGKELEQDQLDTLYKKAQTFDFDTPEAEPADTFVLSLRKYQKQALHWMMNKEKDEKTEQAEVSMHPLWEEYQWPVRDADDNALPLVEDCDKFYINSYSGELSLDFPRQEQNCLGGILADEMGLGKTIEMLSLVHSHRPEIVSAGSKSSLEDLPRLPKNMNSIESAPATTLVVAPMSLLAQWESETIKASQDGSIKVLVHYGSSRNDRNAPNLRHLCCAANAARAPNVVITSYGTVLSEYTQLASSGGDKKSSDGIFSLDYFRVILDEAHFIKNRQSKTAKACYEIAAKHRWVLTGTPIVNRLEDLFSLVHFLRVEPWSNFSFWKTFITVPFDSKDFMKALDVVQTVLEPLVMRRTKDMKTPSGEALVPLPTREINVERLQMSKQEREVYDFILTRAKRTFNSNEEAGTLMKSYTTIFAQILRLRQSCDHPVLTRNKDIVADEEEAAAAADTAAGFADDMDLQSLIERFTADANDGEQDANAFGAHALQQIQDEAENECPICAEEPMIDQTVTGCWHSACKTCLVGFITHHRDKGELARCFNCREPINARDLFQVVRYTEFATPSKGHGEATPRVTLRRVNQPQSAKVAALLSRLTELRRNSPTVKSVVFSQFTSFLDIIQEALQKSKIPYLRFDGQLSQKQRAEVLALFTSDEKRYRGCILLLSLRAGGVGLNLTAAEQVFMMDPWWSWAVEAQAIDRVHRMGQEKEVTVTRFICEDSIEEKMLRIQDRKKFLASSLGMMSAEERTAQRIQDIRELLS